MASDLEAPKPFVPSGFSDGDKLDAGGIEQMRFGLAGSGPLAKAVLDSNAVATRVQLGLGATPIAGVISMYGGTVLPAGYLWCDGSAYDKAVYPGLFTALGVNRYGVDTATQFYLPNLTSHFPRGAATTGGAVATNNNNTHGHSANAGTTNTSSAGNHAHTVNGANTISVGGHPHNAPTASNVATGANNNVASGTATARPNAGHNHTVNVTVGSTGSGHDHSTNTASTFSNTGTDGDHNHSVNAALITVTDNTTYVPAFVEVNYIIKT